MIFSEFVIRMNEMLWFEKNILWICNEKQSNNIWEIFNINIIIINKIYWKNKSDMRIFIYNTLNI